MENDLLKDLKWGLTYGLIFALAYAGIAGALMTSGGVRPSTAWLIIAGYLTAGLVSGLALGVLKAKITTKRRAMILGIIIAYPATMIMMTVSDETVLPMEGSDFVGAAVMAVIYGGWAGWFFGPSRNN